MSNLKDRFKTLLNHYAQFNQIEYLLVENKNDKTVVTGFSNKKNCLVIARMPEQPDFENRVCLTNLAFLKRIFDLEKINADTGEVKLLIGTDLDNNPVVDKFNFKAPGLNIEYQTVDPKVLVAKNQPPSSVDEKFTIEAPVGAEQKQVFDEAFGLQKMMAKKPEDQVVKFSFDADGKKLSAALPYTKTEQVDILFGEAEGVFTHNIKFSAPLLSTMLNIAANNGNGSMMIQSTMLKVQSSVDDITFDMYLLPQK